MSISRMTLLLKPDEKQALNKYARDKVRRPRDQVCFLLIEKLIEEGYLTQNKEKSGEITNKNDQ